MTIMETLHDNKTVTFSAVCCWSRSLIWKTIREEHVEPCSYRRRQDKLNDVRQGVDKFLVT
jgi:hypothetical protein